MSSAFSFLPDWPLAPQALFWAGMALFAAGVIGEFCWRRWRLPRITGYGIVGLIAGSAGFGVITNEIADNARALIDVALGLLMFELGSRLSLRWIRNNPWLIVCSLAESALTFAAVFALLSALHYSLMTSVVVAAIAMATSPAMVVQLKMELKAEGQVSERLLALTALNSMYAVVTVKLASAELHQEFYGNVFATILQPLYLIVGSLLLAYGLARCCQLLYRRLSVQEDHSFVVLFGLVLIAIALAHLLKLSTILALLAAGILLKNLGARPQLWPAYFGTAGWLLTVMLFVLTLISFRWSDIAVGGVGALALIGARLLAKIVGTAAFSRPSGIGWKKGVALGVSLSPMSALSLMLMSETYQFYPSFDPALRSIMLCSVALLQLIAPFLVYRSLKAVDEVPL